MKTMKLAPLILSADYANFESELKRLEAVEELTMPILMSWMQYFVPNISFGAGVSCESMRPHSKLVLTS